MKRNMVEIQLRGLTSDVLDDEGNVTERGGYKTCTVSVDKVDLSWHLFAKSPQSKAHWLKELFEEETGRSVVGRTIFYDGPVKEEIETEEPPHHLQFEKLLRHFDYFGASENA